MAVVIEPNLQHVLPKTEIFANAARVFNLRTSLEAAFDVTSKRISIAVHVNQTSGAEVLADLLQLQGD